MRRHFILILLATSLSAVLAAAPARAQRVGEAAVVKNQVTSGSGGQISVGDGLVRDETVRTGQDSATRLVMIDNTNLSLGPNATLKLDRTVFSGERSYRAIAVNLGSGAFRFVTGDSEKKAYTITTPVATLGVRGTVLDILVQKGQTIVVLQEGATQVCARGTGQCVVLTQPGQTAIITAAGIQVVSNAPWTFASTCTGTSGLCLVTQYADAGPGANPTSLLCGR